MARGLAASAWILPFIDIRPVDATNGFELPGVSVSATGRGGADAAVGDTALSQVENPAALSLISPGRERFGFSGALLLPVLRWEGPLDDSTSSIRAIPLAPLAYGRGVRATDRLFLGAGIRTGFTTADFRAPPGVNYAQERLTETVHSAGAGFGL